MLSQLLESSPRRPRWHYSTLVSIVGHAIALSGAVAAARPVLKIDEPETLIAWHPPAARPPAPCAECASRTRKGGDGEGRTTLPPVPDGTFREITVNLPGSVTSPEVGVAISGDEWRRGAVGERSAEPETGVGRAVVDREVVPFATNPVPRYPAELRAARIEGEVLARFVVDTTGRVRMESVIVDASPHPKFTDAVVDALRRARFQPAEYRGRKVPQLVSQPYLFVLRE
jgi:TonB family protein